MPFDWTQIFPAHSPSARDCRFIAKDKRRNKIVLFGGGQNFVTPSSFLQDTWEFNGTDWTQITTTHLPSKRTFHQYVYDEVNHNVVLFGGYNSSSTTINDTWTYDGTDWTVKSPAHNPSVRFDAFMCWDALNNYVLLFGGVGATGGTPTNAETWKWDGSDWTQLSPTASPPKRQAGGANMVYDPVLNKVILHGGADGATQYHTTYTWNGTTWTQVSASDPVGMGAFQSLAYCLSTGVVIAKGDGRTGTTGKWGGTSWSNFVTVTGSNAATAAICEGITLGSVIMWMGQTSTPTWLANTWYGYDTGFVPSIPMMANEVSLT